MCTEHHRNKKFMKHLEIHHYTPLLCLAALICAVIAVAVLASDHENTSSSNGKASSLERTISKTVPGTEWKLTVTEGPLEPRSIGSYALRFYVPYEPKWPFDNYVDGDVRIRDGSIEELLFEDLNGDDTADVIVTMRSAGSGGYLDADGFVLNKDGVTFVKSVEGLAKDANPVQALLKALETDD